MSSGSVKVKAEDLAPWYDKTSRRHRAALLRSIHSTTVEVEGMVKVRTGEIRPHAPIYTGDYRNRWKHDNTPNGGRVFNESPIAGIIELGVRPGRIPPPKMTKHRRAGFVAKKGGGRRWSPGGGSGSPVPMKSILRWCYLKFRIQPKFRQTKKNPRGKWGKTVIFKAENAAWGMAVAVQRKLNLRGMKGRYVLTAQSFVNRTLRVTAANARRELERL